MKTTELKKGDHIRFNSSGSQDVGFISAIYNDQFMVFSAHLSKFGAVVLAKNIISKLELVETFIEVNENS